MSDTDQPESPEETALLLEMTTSLPAPGQYTAMDRYRDFRKVFMGTDEGKRVMRELLSWGHLFRPSFHGAPIDPLLMAIHEGERNSALKLLATITREPKERPAKANSNPNKDV